MTTHSRSWSAITVLAFAALALFTLISTHARAAGPWYVAPGGSDGNSCDSAGSPCATINGAIGKATAGDTIKVATGTYTSSTGSEVVLIDKDTTLSGGWDAGFTTQSGMSTIDGDGIRLGMTVNTSVVAGVDRFALQNGYASFYGGGLYNWGTITVTNSTISNNQAVYSGGGIYNGGTLTLNNSTISGNSTVSGNPSLDAGGGIYNADYGGKLTLNDSIISDNTAYAGGGIYNYGPMALTNSTVSGNTSQDNGGGIYNNGTATLTNSTISSNTAIYGGGIYSEGYNHGTLTLNNSTVSGNTASGGGGLRNGVYGIMILNSSTVNGNTTSGSGGSIDGGGGILNFSFSGSLTLNNSTISGNASQDGGGGILNYSGTLILNNNTISGNTSQDAGGGILDWGYGSATMQNSILAGNTAASGPDCSGSIGSSGYNLIGNATGCPFTLGTGDLTNANANLGQLIGSPGYHPLLPGSPAINAGNSAGCTDHLGNPLNTDQREAARVGRCDMGAYEYTIPGPAARISVHNGSPQHTPPLKAFGLSLQATVFDSIGTPVSNAVVTFSAPASGASGTFSDSGTRITTAVTNASGVATAATFTANSVRGAYPVTATVSGVITPANFLLSNLAWYVASNGNDGNECQTPATACATINGALAKSGFLAGDTVLVASGLYTSSAGNEVVLLNKSAALSAGWDAAFTTQSGVSTIDGQGGRRGLTVNSGMTASVEYFVIRNGSTQSNGGGIFNNGTLTLTNSTVSGNTSQGGGITNNGTLTLNNTKVSDNTGYSGGIVNFANSTLTLNNSTVNGNTADHGGGINNVGTLNLTNSTISGNTADYEGGGIYNGGTTTLNNSTVSNNAGSWGGGISNSNGTVTLQNSILAGNTAASGQDCYHLISSSGYNIIGAGCIGTAGPGDLLNIDPRLFPLIGSPGYHPLLPGSSAINAGNPAGCTDHLGNPLTTDQRAWPRIGRCDIGAYESFANKQVTGLFKAGGVVTYTISLNNLGGVTIFPGMTLTDTVPISMTYVPDSFFATSGTGGESGGVITWTGTIGTNTETLLTFAAAISPTLPVGSVITNTAQINWNGLTIQTIAQFDTFLKQFLPLISR